MDQFEERTLVAMRRCRTRRAADQYALVLSAMGMASSIIEEGGYATLYVASEDAVRAQNELTAHDHENWRMPEKKARPVTAFPRFEVAMVYWAVLLFFFAVARNHSLAIDWVQEGAAHAGTLLAGEWWRTVTALFLHVSSTHLFGNLVFGTVFLLLLTQVLGAGAAGLAMVTAGAGGNLINALVHASTHSSIGASTAIFAGLGLLVALRQLDSRHAALSRLRQWTPVAAGLGLLAFLGFSGERTDFGAHVFGFVCGVALGYGLKRLDRDRLADLGLQWKCFAITVALITFAWIAAIA